MIVEFKPGTSAQQQKAVPVQLRLGFLMAFYSTGAAAATITGSVRVHFVAAENRTHRVPQAAGHTV